MQAINLDELKRMNQKDKSDFVLINVLDNQAFNKQHIRTSINIPYQQDDFTQKVEQIAGDKTRPIVVYCASEDCDASTHAATSLDRAGFEHVYDFEGGTKEWFSSRQASA